MRKLTAWTLLLTVYLSWIAPVATVTQAQTRNAMNNQANNNLPDGLVFRLSEGSEGAETREVQPEVKADPLSDADSAALLNRLPAIKTDPDDKAEFAKRIGTLPAPKTGEKIPVKFPADDQTQRPDAPADNRALEVVRYSPEGEISLAPDLNVTFSHPMVAVTSQEEAAKTVPVQMFPQVAGNWRWLGTKTLMFDTDKRFPMATAYKVTVPAGTKAATGQTLQKSVEWTFTTPPPKVIRSIPAGQTTKRNVLIFAAFDQAIDPEAVLKSVAVTSGRTNIPVRLATQQEIDSENEIRYAVQNSEAGRWIAFRAINADGSTENALPGDSQITVNFRKGTPSAEGSLTTKADQSFNFRTFGAMKFVEAFCGWSGSKECSPFEQWGIRFSNNIDAAAFKKEMLKIEPALEGQNIYPSGNTIYVQGVKKGRTSYKITVDGSLKDIYGQELGKVATATIKVGSAGSNLYSAGGMMTVLDPSAKASFSVYTTNHSSVKVKLFSVTPNDWNQYVNYVLYQYYDDGRRPTMPGKLIVDRTVAIENVADELVETRIDLARALNNGLGHVIVEVEPTVKRDKNDRTKVLTWLQSTKIGLDAMVDNTELVGFATDLQTGKPLSGVKLAIKPDGKIAEAVQNETPDSKSTASSGSLWDWLWGWGTSEPTRAAVNPDGSAFETEVIEAAQTDTTPANGILRLSLNTHSEEGQHFLLAQKGNDTAFLPENSDNYWSSGGSWTRRQSNDSLRWFVFDDRRMYKPNEEVAVKGYIRKMTAGKLGDVAELGDAASGFSWTAFDARNNEITKGTGNLNAFGSFDFKFKLPDNVNLGYSRIVITTNSTIGGGTYSHSFQVQEFRRPEFEVSAKVETEAPHIVRGNAVVSVEAKYYAGGGLANAETNWTVNATPTSYTPPNRGDFTFGTWVPWWRTFNSYGGRGGGGTTQYFKGVTDESGKHFLNIDFETVNPARPYRISANASVQDVNRQAWASSTTLLVHPSDLYVGIRSPRTFVQKGENIVVESIVSDIDGKLISGRDVQVKATLKDWRFDAGEWKEITVDEQTCTVKSEPPASAGGETVTPSKCTFVAKNGGRYIITAGVMDDRERFNESEITIWVPGGKTVPNRNVEQEEVQIIPSKKDYAPGDVAELLVIAPFTPAEGVLTLRREGIVKTERFTMNDSSITLKIPLEEAYLPNIYAQVNLVGSAERDLEQSGSNADGGVRSPLAKRPAYAAGNINLSISTDSRKLTVSADPVDATLAPGGETKVNVIVKDHNGRPAANTEVAVVIVDESILALTGYSITDPASIFYTDRTSGVRDHHSRKDLLLGNPEDVAEGTPPPPPPPPDRLQSSDGFFSYQRSRADAPAPSMAAKTAGISVIAESSLGMIALDESDIQTSPEGQINLRQNFDALAVFAPSVRTDADGRAVVDVKLPDNLTRYRITAVSVDQAKRFGKGESNITARKPLMVRPSAPRFMNFGDKIELPVVVQNQTDKDMAVDVAVRATNALLTGGNPSGSEGVSLSNNTLPTGRVSASGRRVVVKANSREEVRFPVAADKAGTARFQIAVRSGNHSDAAEISLPVWTPATTEAFATYGTTDQNTAIFQPVQTPGDVFPQFGGLEITTSSTQLQELTDAYIYLAKYPYQCSEQIASRMISTAALRDVLSAFKAKDMPTAAEIEAQFARDVEILQSRQRNDGSFGMWKRDGERYEYPFLTVHVAHALALAKSKGYKVPDEMLNRTKPYLKDIEKHIRGEWYTNSPQVRWTISSYALYIRDMMGDKDVAKAKKLLAEAGGVRTPSTATSEAKETRMPFEALGWTLSVLANDSGSSAEVADIVRFLMNRTTETAAAANFVTNYSDGGWLVMHSNRRADGVLLEALIKVRGADHAAAASVEDLIPKLVRGLLAHRKKGHWGSTQENVFILLAMDRYFNAFESVTPDFVTRVWLGDTYAGEQAFKGRSIDSNQLNIPMSYLVEQGGTSNLILNKQGAGRLYYRIGMQYAPKNLKLDPADYGFTVIRKYEAVDDENDVRQNQDGSWTIKSGARVRVRLSMVASARRYHVALVDYLPAGLEVLNPGLATTEAIPADTGGGNTGVLSVGSQSIGRNYYWWSRNWFEHQNFRDERVEAFASLLWEGVYNYTYVTRATTPGDFIVPPAKAEEMYAPETFGRTGTDFVKVE